MNDVPIILTIRTGTGSKEVEISGRCEKEYNQLALYACSARIINWAKAADGALIPWVREPQEQMFGLAFKFETMEQKKQFLMELL